jgi:hypothetical protein
MISAKQARIGMKKKKKAIDAHRPSRRPAQSVVWLCI